MNPDVVVVGGGIAGLTVAWRLQQAGRSVVLFEASDRVGGAIRTLDVDGVLLEQGPQSLRGAGPATGALVRDLGLSGQVVPASPASRQRLLLHQGRLQALPDGLLALFRGGPVPIAVVARALLEPFVRRGWTPGESVDALVRRRFGPGIAEPVLDAVVGGIYAGDSRQLEAESAFPSLVERERRFGSVLWGLLLGGRSPDSGLPKGAFTFDDGVETLPLALGMKLGGAVQLRTPVHRVESVPGGVRVHLADRVVSARHAVVAVPPDVAAQIVPPWAQVAETIPAAPVAAVHLGWPAGKGPPIDGFGWLAPSTERQDCLGVIWVSSVFPHLSQGLDLVRVMIGGSRAPQLATLSERALVHHAMDVICKVQGVVGEPELSQVAAHRPGIPQYVAGHADGVRQLRGLLPGVHPIGWGFSGVGLTQGLSEAQALADRLITGA